MIFLPNKFERLLSALRNTVQNLILRNGIKPRYLRMMMRIYKSESLFCDEIMPTDLKELSASVLRSAHIKKCEQGKRFSYSVGDIGDCIINPKLYISLLLLLCRGSEEIAIENISGKVVIKARKYRSCECEKEVMKLGGIFLKEIKSGDALVVLSPYKTDKRVVENKKDWLELTNPLSIINCYLQN